MEDKTENHYSDNYGKIGRLAFVVISAILVTIGILAQNNNIIGILMILGILTLIGFRLKNIGRDLTWIFALFIPLLNIWVLVKCFIEPEGYADTEEPDVIVKSFRKVIMICAVLVAVWWTCNEIL